MGEISYSKMRHQFFIRGKTARAAFALREVMNAAAKGALGARVYSPLSANMVQAIMKPYAPQIESRLGLSIDDINERLGFKTPAIQVYQEPNGEFIAVRAFADIVGMSLRNDYVLHVPIAYDGTYFKPDDDNSRLLSADDFVGSGDIQFIKGVGALASPPVLMSMPQDTPLPADFDEKRHIWAKNPFARPQVAG